MNYKLLDSSPTTFALIFNSGDEVMTTLKEFAAERKLKASRFTAIGAFSEAELGFFDFEIKGYKKTMVFEQTEVLSMIGDISLYGDDAAVHAHVVLGRADFSTVGGHLLKGIAHPTLEIILEESPGYLQRRMNQETGLPLISID